MVNITKSGSSLLITSNDNHQFPWRDGQMSIPMNSVTYVLDDSDFIAFKGIANGDILFTANIEELVINGTQATKDNIILLFDSVANSVGSGGGSSAGVESVNGLTGAVLLKTINGEEITGSGDIEIQGGAGVEYISTSSVPSEWDTFKGGVKLTTGFTNFDEGDVGYDIFINGNLADGSEAGSLWFGIRSTDNTLKLTDGGGRVDLQVNPDNFKTINGNSIIGSGDIEIQGGSAGVESIIVGQTSTAYNRFVGDVKFYPQYLDFGDGNPIWQLVMNGYTEDGNTYTSTFSGFKSNSKSIKISESDSKNASIDVNEWTGTQSEYNALGTYDENCTYNIIEG